MVVDWVVCCMGSVGIGVLASMGVFFRRQAGARNTNKQKVEIFLNEVGGHFSADFLGLDFSQLPSGSFPKSFVYPHEPPGSLNVGKHKILIDREDPGYLNVVQDCLDFMVWPTVLTGLPVPIATCKGRIPYHTKYAIPVSALFLPHDGLEFDIRPKMLPGFIQPTLPPDQGEETKFEELFVLVGPGISEFVARYPTLVKWLRENRAEGWAATARGKHLVLCGKNMDTPSKYRALVTSLGGVFRSYPLPPGGGSFTVGAGQCDGLDAGALEDDGWA